MPKPKPTFIAEVKTQSPFGFEAPGTWLERFNLARKHGDMVSIHTHPSWGGSVDLLQAAVELLEGGDEPVVAKGLHVHPGTVEAIMELEVDYCWVVAAKYESDTLHFPSQTILEIEPAKLLAHPQLYMPLLECQPAYLAINSRDLETGHPVGFYPGRLAFGRKLADEYGCSLIQASNIVSPDDVFTDMVDAFAVGEHLPEFACSLVLEDVFTGRKEP